jgi:hypothetical protein
MQLMLWLIPPLYLGGIVNAIIPEVNNGIRVGLIAPDYDIMTNIYAHLSRLVSDGVLTLGLVHQYFPDMNPRDYDGLDIDLPQVIWPGIRRRVSIFTIFGYNEEYGYNINNLLEAVRQYVTNNEYQLLRLSVGSGPGQAEHTQYPELMSHKAPKGLLKLRPSGPRS